MKYKFGIVSLVMMLYICICFPVTISASEHIGSLMQFEEHELTTEEVKEYLQEEAEDSDGFVRQEESKRSVVYRLEWDKYSTNYYYNQLEDAERVLWDAFDTECSSYLGGSTDVSAKSDGSYRFHVIKYEGMSYERARQVYQMFRYSNPQYYFLTNTFYKAETSATTGMMQLSIFEKFAKGADRTLETQKIKSKIALWVDEIQAEENELDKEKKAHDLICENIVYDKNFDNANKNIYNQTIYSVLCTDSTVCAGYAQTMQLLMNAVDIDCAIVTSDSHAWNIICLNDIWYCVDLTWNDTDSEPKVNYNYFNCARMLDVSHKEESFWIPYLPPLTTDSGSNWQVVGDIAISEKQLAVPTLQITDGNIVMSQAERASVYYTTDNTSPEQAYGRCYKYTTPFAVKNRTQFLLRACKDGYTDSEVSDCIVVYAVRFRNELKQEDVYRNVFWGQKVSEWKPQPVWGYDFTGWYKDALCTQLYDFSSNVNEDLVLYAGWKEKVQYTANFYVDGSWVDTQKVYVGEYVQEPARPSRTGYEFTGWYLDTAMYHKYDFSLPLQQNVTLYAGWKKVIEPQYTIVFDACGGSAVANQTVERGNTAVSVASCRIGYTFGGWYTNQSYTNMYNFSLPITGNLTLYANWIPNTYNITYKANGGYIGKKTVTSKKVSMLYEMAYGTQPKAKRKNHAFLGWYTKKSGGTKVLPQDILRTAANRTCYAHWAKIKPKRVSISSLKSKSAGKMIIKIKKNASATGYEIRYSLKKNMSAAKKVNVTTGTKEIKGLKKGKKYYVQARMYQKESVKDKKVYGAWSKTKIIKVKKK